MDSITHLSQKFLQERARSSAQQPPPPPPDMAPPPYSESDSDADDEDDDGDDPSSPPVKLFINSAHSIQGSNNLVPTSPTPLADATKFSTLLLHAVNQINNANFAANNNIRLRHDLKVDLTINCGITIIGDRNVIGNVGLKPKAPNAVQSEDGTAAAVAGAKRKAGDTSEEAEGEPAVKKVALDDSRE